MIKKLKYFPMKSLAQYQNGISWFQLKYLFLPQCPTLNIFYLSLYYFEGNQAAISKKTNKNNFLRVSHRMIRVKLT